MAPHTKQQQDTHFASRSFNSLVFDRQKNIVTKSSSNKEKIADEIDWYLTLPTNLRKWAPKLLHYDKQTGLYELEYIPSKNLAWYFTRDKLTLTDWQLIIDQLFSLVMNFSQEQHRLTPSDLNKILLEKTKERLLVLEKQKRWQQLFQHDNLIINGTVYKNLNGLWSKITKQIIPQIIKHAHGSVIHGDLCLSNVLYDPAKKQLRLVDPRGRFGSSPSIYGDIHYDIAKLSHSFNGLYDFIKSDNFILRRTNNKIAFRFETTSKQQKIARIFNQKVSDEKYPVTNIRGIEGLLFLSMIPLHNDQPRHQLAMYVNAITILNEI